MATAARKTNWFAIWTSVIIVAVLAVVGVTVVVINNQATAGGPAPVSSVVDSETGAIAVGTGEKTVDTYVDFMCPICNQFEQTYGKTLQGLAADGTITLNIHPIAILDRYSQGTNYSTRAANAAYCVADDAPDKVLAFVQAMYAAQPEENSTGLTDEQISAIATQAGASDAVASCISDGTYNGFVAARTKQTPVQPGQNGISTPTVSINGEVLSNQNDLSGDPQADIVARLG